MRICIFLGSQKGQREQYIHAAQRMGRYLASKNIGIVYGGASIGLMGELARSASSANGEVIGIIPRVIVDIEIPESDVSEMHYVDTLEERERLMFSLSDGFIALPGGIGTLEELFTALVWNALKYHNKPIGLLNTCGYYDGLQEFLKFQNREGFVSDQILNSIIIEEEIEALVNSLISRLK